MTTWVPVVLAANPVDGGLVVSDVEDVLQLNAATLAPCFASKKLRRSRRASRSTRRVTSPM